MINHDIRIPLFKSQYFIYFMESKAGRVFFVVTHVFRCRMGDQDGRPVFKEKIRDGPGWS